MSGLNRRIRVLVVDDSATVRRALAQMLGSAPDLELVGTAMDPWVARDKIMALNPDVMLLDVDLPRMNGLTFLRQLMRFRPMPVIVVSAAAAPGSEIAIDALKAGAFDVFHKPTGPLSATGLSLELLARIRSVGRFLPSAPHAAPKQEMARVAPKERGSSLAPAQLIVMAASTGGTEALKSVLQGLPADLPGICVVQHIGPGFSRAFSDRLNEQCRLEVREARSGDRLHRGLALVAPGDFHMEVNRQEGEYAVTLQRGPRVHYQRPAADLLFASAARCAGRHAIGVLLTGMGRDGAEGLKALRDAGARTVAQDEASCVVFGMPAAAQSLGAVERMLPLTAIPRALEELTR